MQMGWGMGDRDADVAGGEREAGGDGLMVSAVAGSKAAGRGFIFGICQLHGW